MGELIVTVLLGGEHGAFDSLAAHGVAHVVRGKGHAFLLARAGVVHGSGEGCRGGCCEAGNEDGGTDFHDGLLWRRMPDMVHPGGV